jgi:p-aminobenzoyl-glutamate transporter AbgT
MLPFAIFLTVVRMLLLVGWMLLGLPLGLNGLLLLGS